MSLRDIFTKWEPTAKVVGIAWTILTGAIGFTLAAVIWVLNTQTALAQDREAIRDLQEQVKPIDEIRIDVKWIKNRLGGPR